MLCAALVCALSGARAFAGAVRQEVKAEGTPAGLDLAFLPLLERLHRDGFPFEETSALFARLGEHAYTPAYTALKILELYGVPGIGVNRAQSPEPEAPPGFTPPLAEFTVGACREFAAGHAEQLQEMEKRHGVGRHVILGLLLVETALGQDLGRDIALRSLAGMAVTDNPAKLSSIGNSRQPSRIRSAKLGATLRQRSDRAYTELKALLRWSAGSGLDAARLPGSIYGAVGLCQFMPSNIESYGVDGDKDGVINLFSPLDAMFSAANYLEAHGWRGAKTDAQRLRVLMAYNDDRLYAAYVLGAAKRMERALAGKISPHSAALAGMAGPSARLDPSLRRLGPVPRRGRVAELGSYVELLK
jgi:membrane-bound lytic murein transglycosylase B